MAALRDPWQPQRRIESRYLKSLRSIADYLKEAIEGEDDPLFILRILNTAINTNVLNRFSMEAAGSMVTMTLAQNARTWREAARESAKGKIIYEALRKEMRGPVGAEFYGQIQRNAEIIKTLPSDLADEVTKYVAKESMRGRRASDIAREIQEMFPERSLARAELIARTEVSKTSTALTQARSQQFGFNWYVWRSHKDQRTRQSHKDMNGVLICWNDPPSPEKLAGEKNPPAPYQAGCIYNCRCFPVPLTGIDRVTWPHKVYASGIVKMMTRAQFEKLNKQKGIMVA